ncbi:MAG TPA: choice-of-anchor D domain-containing protein, partial [Polyangia bacterium]|nr:choice-of-anchor D domain-containing protein [Polyangia bacterium]
TLRVGSASGAIAVLPLSANALSQLAATPATVALGPSGVAGVGAPIQTVTIKNVGAAPATLAVAFQDFGTQTGAGVHVFALNSATPNCLTGGGALAAGDTCTVGVQMVHPITTMGPFSTTMLVTNTLNGQSAAVAVSGTAAQAILQFTPATNIDRDFGTEPLGNISAPIAYTVTNVGNLTSGAIAWGLYDYPLATPPVLHAQTLDFTYTGSTCTSGTTTLAPGISCDIVVAFSPTACSVPATGLCSSPTADTLTETLLVTATPGTAGITHTITANTTKGTALPLLYMRDSSTPANRAVHDFGTTPATVTITLVNAGPAAYAVPAATPAGLITDLTVPLGTTAAAGEFSLVPSNASTCQFAHTGGGTSVASLTAAGGATTTCTFEVAWAPGAAVGTRAVKVALGGPSTAGGASMVLYGRVAGPAVLVANPSSLNFGDVSQGDISPTLTLTVTNIGESPMTGNLAHTNPADTDYSGCTGAGLTAAGTAGASCTVVLDVQPTALGAGGGNLIVRSVAVATQSVTIPVSWTGVNTNPAAINITPAASPLSLGSMAVLATSAPVTVTVTNPANGLPTGPLSFTVDNPDFAVDAGTCGALAHADGLTPSPAADSCTVTVTFTPRTLATPAKTGTLTVKSPYVTATKALSGTAVAALSVSGAAQAAAGEDPLGTAGGVTFTAAAGTTPASCAYGTRAVTTATTTAFRSETFTFQNATGSPTTGVLVADLTGTAAAQFKIVDDTCTGHVVAGGASCKVTVRFSPTTTGAKAAALSLSGTPGDSVSVNLTGTGN